ncbi:MAG: PGF-CTERM sorting domain-containing protein, partial [Candidatus Poseidoniaceae archaeon]
NSQSMGTWTSENIQVIDEDYTGNEHIQQNGVLPLHFERTDATNTVQIQVTFDIENLYIGTTYSVNGSYCSVDWNNDYDENGEQFYTHSCQDILDGFVNEFTVDFTPTSSTQSVTLTIDDPGYSNGANLYNDTYLILGYLRIQGAPVTSNVTNAFVMGGEAHNWNVNGVSNVLLGSSLTLFGDVQFRTTDRYVDAYHVTCSIYADGSTTAITTVDGTSHGPSWQNTKYFEITIPSPTTAGTHYLTCDLIRESNSQSMGTWTSENIQVIDDTSNQDDATIVVGSTMNLQEAWGTVTIDAIDLDAGQEYTLDWVVEDYSLSPPTVMIQNDHIWVAGNDGTYTYELEFHDLADTTDACITVVFTAGDDELQVVDNVCWASASTADGDGDGVYDKNDLCPDTSAGLAVTADGCSDSDNDGFDTDLEIDCNTDPNDALSFPTDLDNDGTCDYLDTDTDGDGYLDVDELAVGTDPFDPLSKPANRLPECAVYYNLEIDGIPTSFDGEAAIPALSGVTATTAAASLTPTTVTIPAGSYYITAHCIDPDGDDVTVTVNEITVGPVAGEVSGAVLIEIGEDVDETMDVQITWSDGTDSLTALVTVELDGGSPGLIPGFGTALTIMALLGAGFVLARKDD